MGAGSRRHNQSSSCLLGRSAASDLFHSRILITQIGMIGLGRMGASMVKRLLKGGHQCVIYDSPTCLLSCEKGAL